MPILINAVRADVKEDVNGEEEPDKDDKCPDMGVERRETAKRHLWMRISAKSLEEHGKEDNEIEPRPQAHTYVP